MNPQDTRITELTTALSGLISAFDAPLYLVGGSVRDLLLGRLSNDLDFTTPAHPQAVRAVLDEVAETVWDTGIDYGTVSARYRGHQIEITTFRADSYDGQSRNPEVTYGDSLDGDLIRRDFTVNAMAIELRPDGSVEFHDPLGGLQALHNGVLDTPDLPERSFNDDPLRMLRAARFVSQLGFQLAPRVEQALAAQAGDIRRITAERVQVELDKLISGEHPEAGIEVLVDSGLGEHIIPEIGALRQMSDEHAQHKDVYAHSLTVLRQAIDQETDGPDLILRWAAVLHDIGKPDTFDNTDGKVSFHHHEVVGAKLVRRRLRALKYPKATIESIAQLVFLHMRFYGFSDQEWTDSAVRRYVTDAGDLLPRLHKLVRADVTTRNQRKARRLARNYDHLEERIAQLAAQEDLARVRPDLDGNAIMDLLGLRPGPEVGQAWSFLKELRLERGPLPPEQAREELLRWWSERHQQSAPEQSQ